MTLHVRPMRVDDVDSVYAIELIAHRVPWSREIIRDCVLVKYDCRILEIEADTVPALASYIVSRYDLNTCHVLNLCVTPHMQGKGYGRFLLQNLINSQEGTSINRMILEVRPSNTRALNLYQKMGFQQIGIKKDYYKDIDGTEDGVVLEKILNK